MGWLLSPVGPGAGWVGAEVSAVRQGAERLGEAGPGRGTFCCLPLGSCGALGTVGHRGLRTCARPSSLTARGETLNHSLSLGAHTVSVCK